MQRLGRHSERLKDLRRRVRRRRGGEVVVDGRKMVADLVRWGVAVWELYLTSEAAKDPEMARLAASAAAVWQVSDSDLATVAPTRHPQGVLAVVAEPELRRWAGDSGYAVYLDGVQDPGNVGAIIRSAAAMGADTVLLGERCADPYHPAAVRGSAGTVFRLPVVTDADPGRSAAAVRRYHGQVWLADAGGTPVSDWRFRFPMLLMFGAEGSGPSERVSELADRSVSIPLGRDVESLNVAVAAGILLHAVDQARS